MASKPLLLLLAFVFLLSNTVTSLEEVASQEKGHHRHHHHVKAPAPSPVHSPKKAPAHAPVHTPTKAPAHAPSHAPKPAPVYPPKTSPHQNHGNCVELCAGPTGYCRNWTQGKRRCVRACVPCCDKYKCVPHAGHNNNKDKKNKCANWDKVLLRDQYVKCP